jgi:ribosome-associated protein
MTDIPEITPAQDEPIPAEVRDRAYDLAQICVQVCQEKKAEDIILFDVQGKTILADYFIVCSGNSRPHIRALTEHLRTAMLEQGLRPRGLDGVPGSSQWVVLDYGVLIIHILDNAAREFYRLEELWDDRKIIFRSNPEQGQAPKAADDAESASQPQG